MDSTPVNNSASKAAPISVRAYARHRGCSAPAVLKAIDRGRLRLSIVIEGGKAKIADVALADREWAENTDLSRASGEIKERANRRRPASESPIVPPPAPEPPQQQPTAASSHHHQPTLKESTPVTTAPGDKPPAPALDPEARWNLNDASAEEKKWKALKAELEYKEKLGELVSAKDVEAAQAALFTLIRTKLLAVPGKARAAAPHLTLADVATLDGLTREVLEELASSEPPVPQSTPATDPPATSSSGAAA
jgi:hypothetical protein